MSMQTYLINYSNYLYYSIYHHIEAKYLFNVILNYHKFVISN